MTANVAMSVLGECLTSKNLDPKWQVFPSILRSKGVNIVPVGDAIATHYVALEHDRHCLNRVTNFVRTENRLLVVVEPRSVHPEQYMKKNQNLYGRVITLSRRHWWGKSGETWDGGHLPTTDLVLARLEESKQSVRMAGSVGIINENKFSLVPGNQYKRRFNVVKEFLDHEQDFCLAGKNWERGLVWTMAKQGHAMVRSLKSQIVPDFRECHLPLDVKSVGLNYFAQVQSQYDFLKQIDFAVVIENEATYLTEKLLNAVVAGCVPLFFGPPLSEFGVPDDVAIQVNGLRGSFYDAYRSTSQERSASIRSKGREWMSNPVTLERWSVLAGFNRLSSRIRELSLTWT